MLTSAETTKFPPLVTPFRLREIEDSFETAKARAAEVGAGSLFYVGRFALIDFALVLEPEEPLRLARKILFAGMNALAETLANIAPPELPIEFVYPASLHFDGALIGGGRIAWPEGCGEDDVPEWLVFGAMIRAGACAISASAFRRASRRSMTRASMPGTRGIRGELCAAFHDRGR